MRHPISQRLQHRQVPLLAPRLLHDLAFIRDNDRVGRDDHRRLAQGLVVDLGLVHVRTLVCCRGKDVLEGRVV